MMMAIQKELAADTARAAAAAKKHGTLPPASAPRLAQSHPQPRLNPAHAPHRDPQPGPNHSNKRELDRITTLSRPPVAHPDSDGRSATDHHNDFEGNTANLTNADVSTAAAVATALSTPPNTRPSDSRKQRKANTDERGSIIPAASAIIQPQQLLPRCPATKQICKTLHEVFTPENQSTSPYCPCLLPYLPTPLPKSLALVGTAVE